MAQPAGNRAPSGVHPPPPQQTLQHRLQGLLQHQQFFWWVGHVIIVLSTLIHAIYWFRFNYNLKGAIFWYRLAFLGAVGSYGVVVHKMFFRGGIRQAQQQEGLFYRLYLDENAEYFALALMWFFTPPVFVALIPYFIYSIFHVITYSSEYVLPAFTAKPARPQEDRLAQLARKYQDAGSQTVAKVEVYGILIRLIIGVIIFNRLAFIQLPVFAVFLRYKYFNTAYTRSSLRELSLNIDRAVNPLPPAVRDVWIKVRDTIAYYGTRPLVAGEGVPGQNVNMGPGATATGAQRAPSGTTQPRM